MESDDEPEVRTEPGVKRCERTGEMKPQLPMITVGAKTGRGAERNLTRPDRDTDYAGRHCGKSNAWRPIRILHPPGNAANDGLDRGFGAFGRTMRVLR